MEEETGVADDAVGFHRDIGESAGPDDVARNVLHVHRDGYMLRGLCHQAVDAQEVILKCTQIHVADEELGAILVGVVGKACGGLKRYAAVADEEGLRITSQEATLAGVSSVVLSWNFEVMQLPRSMLTVFVWSAIIATG